MIEEYINSATKKNEESGNKPAQRNDTQSVSYQDSDIH